MIHRALGAHLSSFAFILAAEFDLQGGGKGPVKWASEWDHIYIYYIGFPGSTQSDTHKSKIGPLLSHGTYLVLRVQCVTKIDLYICAILQIIYISKYRQVLLVACIRGGLDQHIHWANARIKQGVLFCNATNMFYISLIYNYPGNETVSGMNISLIYKF